MFLNHQLGKKILVIEDHAELKRELEAYYVSSDLTVLQCASAFLGCILLGAVLCIF